MAEPPVRLNILHDALRAAVADSFVRKTINPFRQDIIVKKIDQATIDQGAIVGTAKLDKLTATTNIDPIVKNFVTAQNCQQTDISIPLTQGLEFGIKSYLGPLMNRDRQGNSADFAPIAPPFTASDYFPIAQRIQLPAGELIDTDKPGLAPLLEVAAGCTANHQVPFLDPQTMANVLKCSEDSQRAYFAMSGFDVATHATRSVYTYIIARLKIAIGQLESGDTSVPLAATGDTAGNTTTVAESPELRRRAAIAIRTIMLPAVESQLDRLNTLETTRGTFAKRLDGILKTKSGCL